MSTSTSCSGLDRLPLSSPTPLAHLPASQAALLGDLAFVRAVLGHAACKLMARLGLEAMAIGKEKMEEGGWEIGCPAGLPTAPLICSATCQQLASTLPPPPSQPASLRLRQPAPPHPRPLPVSSERCLALSPHTPCIPSALGWHSFRLGLFVARERERAREGASEHQSGWLGWLSGARPPSGISQVAAIAGFARSLHGADPICQWTQGRALAMRRVSQHRAHILKCASAGRLASPSSLPLPSPSYRAPGPSRDSHCRRTSAIWQLDPFPASFRSRWSPPERSIAHPSRLWRGRQLAAGSTGRRRTTEQGCAVQERERRGEKGRNGEKRRGGCSRCWSDAVCVACGAKPCVRGGWVQAAWLAASREGRVVLTHA